MVDTGHAGLQALMGDSHGLDRDCRGEDAREEGMQSAAAIGLAAAPGGMMVTASVAVLHVYVMMLQMEFSRMGEGLRTFQRRRNHAGKLCGQE